MGSVRVHPAVAQGVPFSQVEAPFDVLDTTGQPLTLPFLGGFNVPRPQLVDIDGDGDDDLFVQELSNQLIFHEHLSSSAAFPFVKRSDAYLDLAVGEWFRFVDLDQDGDQDLLAESPFSHIRVYENTGGPAEPMFLMVQDSLKDETGTPIFADRQNILNVVDIDADGLQDLFVGRLDGTIFHYEQTVRGVAVGEMAFSLQSERFQDIMVVGPEGKRPDLHGANTLLFFDVDQDNDVDLFWGDFFEEGLLYFQNLGTPQIPLFVTDLVRFPVENPFATGGYNAPAFGDVNGDGRDDLLVGVLGGAFTAFGAATDNLLYFRQDENQQFSFVRSRFFANIDEGSDSAPVLFDVDSDGDLDLLVGNSIDPGDPNTASVRWFENIGNASQPLFQDMGKLALEPDFGITPTLADLNNDGSADMITGSFGGAMTVYWNDHSGDAFSFSRVEPDFLDIPSGGSSAPHLADMDADGDADLLVGQSNGALTYFENRGSALQPEFSLITSSYEDIDVGRRSAPITADVDEDGDLDLIVGSDLNGLFTYENIGTPQVAEFVPANWLDIGTQRRMVPAWGDLNGDSKPELMIGLLNGGVLYFENQSGPVSLDPEVSEPVEGVELFPNPVKDVVQIQIKGTGHQHVEVGLFNLLGQRVGEWYHESTMDDPWIDVLDLSPYAAGAYLLQIKIGTSIEQRILFKSE